MDTSGTTPWKGQPIMGFKGKKAAPFAGKKNGKMTRKTSSTKTATGKKK